MHAKAEAVITDNSKETVIQTAGAVITADSSYLEPCYHSDK